jgi:hypothetical protein
MRFIPTWVHGILDYIYGLALLFAPNIFQFSGVGGAAETLPRILGIIALASALMTDYELGLFKAISMRMHLTLDAIIGLLLIVGPFIFGFSDLAQNVWVPYIVIGAVVILAGLMTETKPRHMMSPMAR